MKRVYDSRSDMCNTGTLGLFPRGAEFEWKGVGARSGLIDQSDPSDQRWSMTGRGIVVPTVSVGLHTPVYGISESGSDAIIHYRSTLEKQDRGEMGDLVRFWASENEGVQMFMFARKAGVVHRLRCVHSRHFGVRTPYCVQRSPAGLCGHHPQVPG